MGSLAAFLHTPSIGSSWVTHTGAISQCAEAAGLTPRIRTIVATTVVNAANADYAIYGNGLLGKGFGLTDEELAAIEAGKKPNTLS